MAQQHLDFGTSAPNDAEFGTTAFPKIEDNFDELYGMAGLPGRVMAGGIVDTLITDDTSARAANTTTLNAAFDYAYNNALGAVRITSGLVECNRGLLLGPTDSFNHSISLQGPGVAGADTEHGALLRFPDGNTPALIVGTGQGMRSGGFAISGPELADGHARVSRQEGDIGVALAGGSGGLSRCTLAHMTVRNFLDLIVSGYNDDQLCDSVTLFKVHASGGYRGWHVKETQNYINSAIECTFSDNTTHIYSPTGKAVNVIGGNYSTTNANRNAFMIGSTSGFTPFADSHGGQSFTNWSFTTTLAADDQPMVDGALDAFAVVTEGFGVVPLVRVSYNSGTRVATMKLYGGWVLSHYKSVDLDDDTDIEAEVAAATTLYACETVTLFSGIGINADGVHVENPGVMTRLVDGQATVNGDSVNRVTKAFFNYAINQADLAGGTEAQKAAFYCQQAHPFVRQWQADTVLSDIRTLEDGNVGFAGNDGVLFEVLGVNHKRLIVRNRGIFGPNIIVPAYGSVGDVTLQPSMSTGAGEWDSTPFIAATDTAQFYAMPFINGVPFRGWVPAPSATPRLTAAQLADIEDGLGAIGTYPPLCGETIYSVLASDDTLFFRSKHSMWSYGQNLSIDWEYLGQTNVLRVSSADNLFAGLRITIDNGGGDQSYTITGVYPTLGYVTVFGVLAGTKTTTYDGATIKQAAYDDIIKVAGA